MPKIIATFVLVQKEWNYRDIDKQTKRIKDKDKVEKWIQEAIIKTTDIHNAPKQVSFRASPIMCDIRQVKTLKPLTKGMLDNNPVLEIRVSIPLKEDAERAFALLMATHGRLGEISPLARIPIDLLASFMRGALTHNH